MAAGSTPERKGGLPWVWILGFFWIAVVVIAVAGIGSDLLAKSRAASKEIADPNAIGAEERTFFLTPEELGAAGIWKLENEIPGAPKVSRIKAGTEPYYVSTYARFGDNPGVVQTSGLVAGPSWIAKMAFHEADKVQELKKGYEERPVSDTGKHDYSAWRYCKGEVCRQFLAMAASEGKIFSITVVGDAHPDPDKLGAALEAALARIELYKVAHRNR